MNTSDLTAMADLLESTPEPVTVAVRYFAGAAEAARSEAVSVSLPHGSTVGDLVEALGEGDERLAAVLAICSFLVDGTSTTDRSRTLQGSTRVDVLPPFAGG